MYLDLECGVCFRTYNTGVRCPRELPCKHTFCENCLLAVSKPPKPAKAQRGPVGTGKVIVCPLCRQRAAITGDRRSLRAELRVDESVLEQMMVAGVLDQEDEDEPRPQMVPEKRSEEEVVRPGSGEVEAGSGGRLGRSWRRLLRSIRGEETRRRNHLTSDDVKALMLMTSYMF